MKVNYTLCLHLLVNLLMLPVALFKMPPELGRALVAIAAAFSLSLCVKYCQELYRARRMEREWMDRKKSWREKFSNL